ncbi:hypothetical protein Pint_20849 [Pistacia integerrima]|uniref:Uncharacterized protein n=1 Tax=Pistacia integerrima TaxID=434235 RepID=A0ACC0XFB4_9ROSI|nr:hypothetical protein Pint_20849 [Pistacia integerrima]
MNKSYKGIVEAIEVGIKHDPLAKQLVELAIKGKTKWFWVEDDLLYTKGKRMQDKVEQFGRTCLVCQQNKVENKYLEGLVKPLLTPERPWMSTSMDFITTLLISEGCGLIISMVDRHSKYETFMAAPKLCATINTAQLFFKYAVKYWGLPQSIINDRDSQFTGKFWTKLLKLMGSALFFSTTFILRQIGKSRKWMHDVFSPSLSEFRLVLIKPNE